ncbi:MAG: hypothetical protein M3065_23145 [Actinomycetota bacterium]|nr:hypothetical protein [Actinomycetota bacterium]
MSLEVTVFTDPACPFAFSSEPACRAVVATRLHAHDREPALLRVRAMRGGLLDDPGLLAAAARDAGLEPSEVDRWSGSPDVDDALRADIDAARCPSPAARALDHKLGWPARAAALHRPELRDHPRRQRRHGHPRLQPD